MGISDFEFSDDDDEFLGRTTADNTEKLVTGSTNSGVGLVVTSGPVPVPRTVIPSPGLSTPGGSTPNESTQPLDYSNLPPEIKSKLYKADGEIAILRNQLHQAQSQGHNEVIKLKQDYENSKTSMQDQIKDLKTSVQCLQDEKVFLENEVRTGFNKRRKLTDTTNKIEEPRQPPKVIKVQNETSLLIDHIWKLTINGSPRTTMNYLSKLCIDKDITINNFTFTADLPISGLILEYLILQKDLRLDILFENFLILLINLIGQLVDTDLILSIPFLISVIHGTLMFKPLATKPEIIIELTEKLIKLINHYSYNLNPEEIINMNINLTLQYQILQKFIIICSMDTIETLIGFTLVNSEQLGLTLYENHGLKSLINNFLPKNIERCQDILQVNLLENIIKILSYICHENNGGGETILTPSLCQLLLKLCLIDIPIKDGFRFYGLNRILGNNQDFNKIDIIIPKHHDQLNNAIVSRPIPIINFKEPSSRLILNHESHLFELNIAIIKVIENHLLRCSNLNILQNKDTVKIIIKIIKNQQNLIGRNPRSKLITQRITVISNLIRSLNYLFKFETELGLVIYSDSLVELVIILSTIGFGAENLVNMSNTLVKNLRMKNYRKPIFNKSVELRAREAHHLNGNDKTEDIIEAEIEYPNGLEYPYDNETIELSREILAKIINTEAADNLYLHVHDT